jgi:hypothetical protein
MKDSIYDNIEIATRLCEHQDVIKLCNILGNHSFIYLIFIWMWLKRHNFDNGVFPEIIKPYDIELIAKWEGTPNNLSSALMKTGWIRWNRETNSFVMKGIDSESLGEIIFFSQEA